MKIATVLGAQPQFVKAAMVSHAIKAYRTQQGLPFFTDRILTDRISVLLFCPPPNSVDILQQEGLREGVHLTGDVMFDASLYYASMAQSRSDILSRLQLAPQHYYLATVHRPVNADAPEHMECILRAFSKLDRPVVFPVHPRTQKMVARLLREKCIDEKASQLRLIDPVGYLDMLVLEKYARTIITDSGEVQKEAYFFKAPCVTLRPETEWIETVELGWNRLCRIDEQEMLDTIQSASPGRWEPVFGEGAASEKIVKILSRYSSSKN